MYLQLAKPWFNRIFCGLLIAMIVAPEVRCCCNLSWGPAGLCQPVCPLAKAAAKPKCCCCTAETAGDSHSSGLQDCDQCDGGCSFWTVSSVPVGNALEWEQAAVAPLLFSVSLASELSACCPVDRVFETHPPLLTAQQHCALFQSWQT